MLFSHLVPLTWSTFIFCHCICSLILSSLPLLVCILSIISFSVFGLLWYALLCALYVFLLIPCVRLFSCIFHCPFVYFCTIAFMLFLFPFLTHWIYLFTCSLPFAFPYMVHVFPFLHYSHIVFAFIIHVILLFVLLCFSALFVFFDDFHCFFPVRPFQFRCFVLFFSFPLPSPLFAYVCFYDISHLSLAACLVLSTFSLNSFHFAGPFVYFTFIYVCCFFVLRSAQYVICLTDCLIILPRPP